MVEKKIKGIFYILMLVGSFALLTQSDQMDYGGNVSPPMAFYGLVSLIYWGMKCMIALISILLNDDKEDYDYYGTSRRGSYKGKRRTYNKTARCHSDSFVIGLNGQYNPIPLEHERFLPKQKTQEDVLVKDLSEQIKIQENIKVVMIDNNNDDNRQKSE